MAMSLDDMARQLIAMETNMRQRLEVAELEIQRLGALVNEQGGKAAEEERERTTGASSRMG